MIVCIRSMNNHNIQTYHCIDFRVLLATKLEIIASNIEGNITPSLANRFLSTQFSILET